MQGVVVKKPPVDLESYANGKRLPQHPLWNSVHVSWCPKCRLELFRRDTAIHLLAQKKPPETKLDERDVAVNE